MYNAHASLPYAIEGWIFSIDLETGGSYRELDVKQPLLMTNHLQDIDNSGIIGSLVEFGSHLRNQYHLCPCFPMAMSTFNIDTGLETYIRYPLPQVRAAVQKPCRSRRLHPLLDLVPNVMSSYLPNLDACSRDIALVTNDLLRTVGHLRGSDGLGAVVEGP